MKSLILFSLLLSSAVFAQWPEFELVNPESVDGTSIDSSDPTDEYPDSDASDTLGICWKHTYARVGYPLVTSCSEGLVKIGAYCYHPCKEGYTEGFFSGMSDETDLDPEEMESTSDVESYCWQNCPKGFEDDYRGQCWNGTLSIEKKNYNRTFIEALDCPPGLEFGAGLCYPPAKEGYRCDGSLCQGKCPKGWDICGAFCTKLGLCKAEVMFEGIDVGLSVGGLSSEVNSTAKGAHLNVTAVPGVLNGTQYPFCH